MKYIVNIIFQSSLAAFLVLAVSEFIRPGTAANFIPLGGFFLLVFVFAVLAAFFPIRESSRIASLVSVPLTLLIIGCIIVLTWNTTRELGKINLVIVLGALAIVAGAIKAVFGQKESR